LNPLNTKQLRQKILDLAIRGKLVPQDPNDEPASILLEKIFAEKERFNKKKKIKHNKNDDTSHYRNVPFEVPRSWVWVRLNDISSSIQYGYTSSAIPLGKYKMLRITDIQNNSVDWEIVPYVEIDDKKAENYLLSNQDIVFARTGATVGKSFLIKNLKEKSIFASYLIRIKLKKNLDVQYVKYFFESGYYWEQIEEKSVGTGQPNVNGTLLSELLFPLPPLSEQRRIVSVIESAFALIDEIEKKQQALEQLIKQAKSKVLDLAIRGKLVPQDPNDEPVSILLERIRNEQKSKKITTDISQNTQLSQTPYNWLVCKLSDICIFERGITFPSSAKQTFKPSNSIACVRTANVQEKLELCDLWYIDKSFTKANPNKLLRENDIIISSANSRELVGKTSFVEHIRQEMTFGGFVMVIRTLLLYNKFLFYFLRDCFYKGLFTKRSTQTTNIANINTAILGDFEIQIPPLKEQYRIVQKIEAIFQTLDSIQNNLKLL
jgi:type I restriction enzyme S subunit